MENELAHFLIYAFGSICLFFILKTFHYTSMKAMIGIFLIISIIAIADEYTQSIPGLISGRSASFSDVINDMSGGVFGIVLINNIPINWRDNETT